MFVPSNLSVYDKNQQEFGRLAYARYWHEVDALEMMSDISYYDKSYLLRLFGQNDFVLHTFSKETLAERILLFRWYSPRDTWVIQPIQTSEGGGGSVDLSNYVQKTDIATVSTPGLVAASDRTKFVVFANTGEVVCTSVQSINEASKLDQNAFISKGTLDTLKSLYVKQGITENTYILTDTEKQKVRNWIGAGEPVQKVTMPLTATVGTIVQYIGETNGTYTNGYFYKYALLGEGYTTNATSTITSFDFDQFWADVESAGYTAESLGLDESTKAKGGFRIMGVIRSETVMDLMQINGVTVSLSTESMTFGSNFGQRLTFYYQTGKIYEWQQIDVQPVPEVSGDYLPLTGGTLTGAVDYELGELKDYVWSNAPLFTATFSSPGDTLKYKKAGIYATANGVAIGDEGEPTPIISFSFKAESVDPGSSRARLGSASSPWYHIATNKIVAGIDTTDYSSNVINIPNKKGTMVVATPPTEDGSYVLKCVVVDGVPTVSWVKE